MADTEVIAKLETELNELKKKIETDSKKQDYFSENQNFLNNLFFSSGYDGLYYIQTISSLFVFKRTCLSKYYDFLKTFMLYHSCRNTKWNFGVLDETCDLYKEHKESFDKGVILHKYMSRFGIINHTIISADEKGKLYAESEYLGMENYHSDNKMKYVSQAKREIVDGITLSEYMKNKSEIEKKAILRLFYDYLFETFPSETDKNKVQGILLDAHSDNVIINNDGFHFVDRDVVYSEDVKKSLVLWDTLGTTPLYYHFMKYYNLPEDNEDYTQTHPCLHQNTPDMKEATAKNKKMFKRYFGPDGLQSHPVYSINLTILDADIPSEILSYVNSDWYKATYPECLGKNLSPAAHYMTIGWKKGFNPSPDFDGNRYLNDYPDIARAGMNPLEHYVHYGKKEGRTVYPVEDVKAS